MEAFFPAEKIVISGNPLRQSLIENVIDRDAAIQFFGLDPAKKTILSIGGSLGAKNINEAISAELDFFEKNNLQLIWQTGKAFAEKGKQIAKGKNNIWVNDFINQMEYAFAAGDVVISRSGAMSVGELCVMKKPTVFVPFPFAAEDHQTVNAKKLVDKQAACMVNDKNAAAELLPVVLKLVNDAALQEVYRKNMELLAIKNADEIIAKEILKSLGYKN
jgi:UDP-N-acetylglucosamine--N-acetylmuramyl-(pentapeptide) pyrophosphoryl-undecaprenol N-acetylglucosamine transferase